MKCVAFSGIINTGIKDIAVEMKSCTKADLCRQTMTYMAFPVANESKNDRSAIRNRAKIRLPTPFILVLFLQKLLY